MGHCGRARTRGPLGDGKGGGLGLGHLLSVDAVLADGLGHEPGALQVVFGGAIEGIVVGVVGQDRFVLPHEGAVRRVVV